MFQQGRQISDTETRLNEVVVVFFILTVRDIGVL